VEHQASHLFFIILCVCAMALTHPSWEHWYQVIFRPRFVAAAILALGYILVAEVTTLTSTDGKGKRSRHTVQLACFEKRCSRRFAIHLSPYIAPITTKLLRHGIR
jgi:hypothetical protein